MVVSMKEIKPTYITFEQAKWLKEKGFDEECLYYFKKDGTHSLIVSDDDYECQRPEQWLVVEWLRLNHSIWVEVIETELFCKYFFQIKRKDNTRLKNGDFNSPQEAYSRAFDFIKNYNLI